MQTETRSLDEFNAEARRFAAALVPRDSGATVVALSGDLGAGKTTFVQAVAAHFGIPEPITSPTFVIEKVYECASGPFKRLIHIDAYRLRGEHDLGILGWHELLAEPSNLVFVEWPERVADAIPSYAIRIAIGHIDAESRALTIHR